MAAETDERTEPATPRRRQEARARGHVPRSTDLTAALMLLAGFLALEVWGLRIGDGLMQAMRRGLDFEAVTEASGIRDFLMMVFVEAGKGLWPLLAVLWVVAIGVMFAQVGPLLTMQPISPSLDRLNPFSGFRRLFSSASWVTAATGLVKLTLLGFIVYWVLAGSAASILAAFRMEPAPLFLFGSRLTIRLGLALSVAFVVLALLDYVWQRHRYDRNLRMTKEEVKDEFRSMEGDAAVKRRRRQIQLQLAAQRLKKDVPKADVVVTNPTHLAVAVAYDHETMVAPKVVAKGADYMALRIRRIAQAHGIPIVERKPLARALFDAVDVGHYIPERFYVAIAEILAYVYELTGRGAREVRATDTATAGPRAGVARA
jgi:flagellar biosynthetic protein FlhB